ncbi:MAG: nuclear transport factor 2 family protein [Cyclobacteriaceae bacterium]
MFAEKSIEIGQVIHNYLEGIYQGDVERLRSSFTDNAQLRGEVKGAEYFKSLENYLEGVKNRKSPRELGEVFKMKILSLEIVGNVATAKLHVPMLGYNYYDFLSLCIVKGEWKIVNKLFTHVE